MLEIFEHVKSEILQKDFSEHFGAVMFSYLHQANAFTLPDAHLYLDFEEFSVIFDQQIVILKLQSMIAAHVLKKKSVDPNAQPLEALNNERLGKIRSVMDTSFFSKMLTDVKFCERLPTVEDIESVGNFRPLPLNPNLFNIPTDKAKFPAPLSDVIAKINQNLKMQKIYPCLVYGFIKFRLEFKSSGFAGVFRTIPLHAIILMAIECGPMTIDDVSMKTDVGNLILSNRSF